MAATIIKNARIILEDSVIDGGVTVENGVIIRIFEGDPAFSAETVIDGRGLYLSPGFIDTHCHGAGGCDYMDGSVSAMETAAKTQLRFGATTIVPTALSGTEEEILNFIKYFKILKANMQNGPQAYTWKDLILTGLNVGHRILKSSEIPCRRNTQKL